MRVITQHQYGTPDVLTIQESPSPEPLPTEVLVRVAAVGLNPLEARLRQGEFPLIGQPPFVLGWDVSGVVEKAMTWRFSAGDEVFGMSLFPRAGQTYAEYAAVPALHLVRKPKNLSFVEAAALPLAGLTAWHGLIDLGHIKAGDRVLVHAGGGGVGHLAIQIAKAFGAYVITTASTSKTNFVRELGADEVIDYVSTKLTDAVRDVDVVLDTLGGDAAMQSVSILRPGGHLITAVDEDRPELIDACVAAGMQFSGIAVDPDPVGLQGLTDLVEQGALRVHVSETYRFEDVVAAHQRLDGGHLQGKIVLAVDSVSRDL
jgi:NADPH:quinone reductase-like Zn-dependent oxidoreductase